MQFLRNSLSLSFLSNSSQNQQQPQQPGNGTVIVEGDPAAGPRGSTDGKLTPSPSVSNLSDRSKYATVRSKLPLSSISSAPSEYSTPVQSPVIASRTFPVLGGAARTLNGNGSNDGTQQSLQERTSKVYFIEQGQLQTEYELPERPGRGQSVDGGVVNPAFTNDSGATMINMSSTTGEPSVIREQYWTWSCRCRREYTPREKVLLILIFVLVLIIGGLATYLGIVVDSDDSITGGLLTRSAPLPPSPAQR